MKSKNNHKEEEWDCTRIPKELLINEHYIKSDLKRKQEPMMEEGTTPTSAGCSILLDDSEL